MWWFFDLGGRGGFLVLVLRTAGDSEKSLSLVLFDDEDFIVSLLDLILLHEMLEFLFKLVLTISRLGGLGGGGRFGG
jgi:hypothetical protein